MKLNNIFFSLQENNASMQDQKEMDSALVALSMKNDLDSIPSEKMPIGDFWKRDQRILDNKQEKYLSQSEMDELLFMRKILNAPDMKNLFKDSPKSGNIQFNLEANVDPFSYSYKDGEACIVKGSLTKGEDGLDYHVPKELKAELSLNEEEKNWQKELIARHELNHCRFNDLQETLFLTGDKEINSKINELASSNNKNKLSMRVNEGFVETLAVIQMLKQDDSSKFKEFIEKHTIMRESGRLAFLDQKSQVHTDIPIALKILMQDENLNKIKKINPENSEEMEKMALKVANQATRYSLAQMSVNERKEIYSSVVEGVTTSLNGVLATVLKGYAKEQFGATKVANFESLYDDTSNEKGVTRKAADKYINELSRENPQEINKMLQDMTALGEVKRSQEQVKEHSKKFIEKINSNPEKYFGKGIIGVLDKLEDDIQKIGLSATNTVSKEETVNTNMVETKLNIEKMKEGQTGFLKITADFASNLDKIKEDFDNRNNGLAIIAKKTKP